MDDTAEQSVLHHRPFQMFWSARVFASIALQMQSVAVGWQVYEITKRPLDLGLVGLAQFLPGIFLFLVAGHLADRFDRRRILLNCYGGMAACSGLLLVLAFVASRSVYPIYLVLVLLGIVRTINWPASRAILPQLVPDEHLHNAIALERYLKTASGRTFARKRLNRQPDRS